MTTLRQVVNVVETLYPLRYAESWDAPGLIVGEPGADVGLVAFAADPTMAVIDEAIERGADLLICHHPLLFRSVHAVSGQDVHAPSSANCTAITALCGWVTPTPMPRGAV